MFSDLYRFIINWIKNSAFKRVFIFYLISFSSLCCVGQNRNLKATVDTTNFTLRFDSSAVVFNGELSDKDFWYDIFSNDDSLINYFRKKAPGRAYYVYIANIEKDNLLSYTFVIYCRPKNIEPKDINSFGYASYFIKLSRRIDKSYKVVEIKLNGLMI